jgi:hypothetical protein
MCSACDNRGALFGRMSKPCTWGVSDPLPTGLGAKKGGAKWGSLTPRLPPTAAATDARGASAGGTMRRPLTFVEVADCQ